VVAETVSDPGKSNQIYASVFGVNSHLNPVPPSPSLSFPEPPSEALDGAIISGDDISSFTTNLLMVAFGLGSSSMRGNLDPSPSLVGDKDILLESVEPSLDVSKWRGREDEGPEVFKLNRELGCVIDRSPSPPILRDGQFRE